MSALACARWGQAGVSLPHSSAMQYDVVPHVSRAGATGKGVRPWGSRVRPQRGERVRTAQEFDRGVARRVREPGTMMRPMLARDPVNVCKVVDHACRRFHDWPVVRLSITRHPWTWPVSDTGHRCFWMAFGVSWCSDKFVFGAKNAVSSGLKIRVSLVPGDNLRRRLKAKCC